MANPIAIDSLTAELRAQTVCLQSQEFGGGKEGDSVEPTGSPSLLYRARAGLKNRKAAATLSPLKRTEAGS